MEKIKITELKPYKKNPRKNDGAVKMVKKSIKEFGFRNPILIDKDNVIIAGHTRLRAVKELREKYGDEFKEKRKDFDAEGKPYEYEFILNLKEVPYIKIEDLTPAQVKAFRIMDNKSAEFAEWDTDFLKTEFEDLDGEGFNLEMTGFDSKEIGEIWEDGLEVKEDIVAVDAYERAKKKTKIKQGDIYQLGDHKLMCGDSTESNNVNRLIDKNKVELLLTDPPYGIDIVGKGKSGFKGGREIGVSMLAKAGKYQPMKGDDKPFDPTFLLQYGKIQIIWGANNFASKLPDNSHWLIWDKKCEKGADHNNFSDCELAWTNVKRKATRIYRYLWSGLLREGKREEELKKRVHPTQKPVGLMAEIIKDYAKESVLDLFGGSGTTLIACEQLNRKCFMMEIDPVYCQVIIDRWEKFTKKKANKSN